MALLPQAALETAVVQRLQPAVADGGLGYLPRFCGRTIDGSPPPSCGSHYVAVWHDGARQSEGGSTTALNEVFGVYVTVTVRLVQPFDRWVAHRDELEAFVNDIRALIGKDVYTHLIANAANTLAGLRLTDAAPQTQAVGFREALKYQGLDPIQLVGGDWFKAVPDQTATTVGLAQKIRFGGARLVQSWANAQ